MNKYIWIGKKMFVPKVGIFQKDDIFPDIGEPNISNLIKQGMIKKVDKKESKNISKK